MCIIKVRKYLKICLFTGLCMFHFSSLAGAEEGLVLYYTFDEGDGSVAYDKSGNNNNGKIEGAEYVKQKEGYALEFNGATNRVIVENAPSLDITEAITVEIWIYPRELHQWHQILGKGQSGVCKDINYDMWITPNNKIRFRWVGKDKGDELISKGSINKNWHHVTATIDSSKKVKIYINGVLDSSSITSAYPLSPVTQMLDIGGYRLNWFYGLIGEVRIYNCALPGKEVRKYYQAEVKQFAWHSAPLPPVILELTAPREIFSKDVSFMAKVGPDVTETVHFAIKTYAGKTIWTRKAKIINDYASVVLKGKEAAKMEKGSRVLVATVNGKKKQSAYAAVYFRGRIFRNVIKEPADMRPGDEIVITDMSRLRPSGAISRRSVKGKWWRRSYTIEDEAARHSLVCVEEHDMENPESCLAPQLKLPLKLKGWYEIWVRTYRHRKQGGIDVRLSGEKYFVRLDPLQINTAPGYPHPSYDILVDILYRAADLTGQYLIFQQPYGTYASDTKLCNASMAGVRLVKLSDEQVIRIQNERVREDTKVISFDEDFLTYVWRWGTHNPDCIARMLEPLRDQSVAFVNIELGGVGGLYIPTPYTGMNQMRSEFIEDGYARCNAFIRWCFKNNINSLDILAERAHELNIKLFASLMMERSFSFDETMRLHPEWRIMRKEKVKGNSQPSERCTWDYANPEVQKYQIKKIAWIIEHHDIDGFIVDFTRYGHHFNRDEPDKFGKMNDFLRRLRVAIDEVNTKKERKVLLCASFGDESWHLQHWGTGKLEDQGLDIETWLKENIFDIIMPEGVTAIDFVKMAKKEKSRTEVWPRKVHGVTFETHRRMKGRLGPKGIEKGVKWMLDYGAPGVFFFNHMCAGTIWTTLGRLGFKEELELRTKTDEIYGYREGAEVKFTTGRTRTYGR